MLTILTLCRHCSLLSPSTGTRLALLLLDLASLPDRARFALALAIDALREHDPEHQARRHAAARMMRDLLADLRKSETQRKREAN